MFKDDYPSSSILTEVITDEDRVFKPVESSELRTTCFHVRHGVCQRVVLGLRDGLVSCEPGRDRECNPCIKIV